MDGHSRVSRDLRDTARFLHEVFPVPRFADERYLSWYYRTNPVGPAVETDLLESGSQLGHFAGIPQVLHSTSGTLKAALLVDVSVSARARGRGLMSVLHDDCAAEARARFESGAIIGVANTPATPVYRKRLGYRILGPLPTLVCPPLWPDGRVLHTPLGHDYVQSDRFADVVATFDLSPTAGWTQKWSLDLLRFRLASPGASYWLHLGDRVAAITTRVKQAGVPVAVVLKTFRRGGGEKAPANAIIAAACRYHRAPAAIYAGRSPTCRVAGIPLPERLKPAPLNFIVRGMKPGDIDEASFVLDGYEFLDFDAF